MRGLTGRRRRAASAAAATVVALLAIVAGALGAVGDLTPQGCIANTGDVAGCGATAQGLEQPSDVAVGPDGASVYTLTDGTESAIARFDRAPGGALTPAGCISDDGDPAGCGVTTPGIDGADGVAVSPDGASVYVASQNDNAIVRFDRAPSGALSNPSCIEDVETDGPCDDVGPVGEAQGLNAAHGVAVSPDGASVYVVSFVDDAVVRFDRAPSGALSNPSCIEDPPSSAGCGTLAEGLDNARRVAVSPDGANVYAAGLNDDAIVRFDRAPSGALAPQGCIEDVEANLECDNVGPAGEAQGLDGPGSVAVSLDGASFYAAGGGDDAIVRFDRAPTGALSNSSCISDVATAACGTATAEGLEGASGVAVSPDGASVYVASGSDNAIVRFDRAPSGELSNSSCIEDLEADLSCDDIGPAGETQGLDGARRVAVSPDGTSVYVIGNTDDTIVRFDREVPPAPPPEGEAPDTDPPNTQITKGPKNKTRRKRATFEFISTEPGSTFECSLDGKAFVPCASPDQVKVKKGKHAFRVRATDAAGNVDPTPASDAWKVKKKKRKR